MGELTRKDSENSTMAAKVYECMLLLDPNKVSGDLPAAANQLHTILERNHAEVLASRQWDDRRLAYPIKGHKKGLYYLTYFRTDGQNLATIEHDFSLSELVLRALTLRVDPKLVDTMLALARDEHAMALQSVPEAVGDEGGIPEDALDEPRGPRRPRRGETDGYAAE
jgi:small subunit ribosomal protein S6